MCHNKGWYTILYYTIVILDNRFLEKLLQVQFYLLNESAGLSDKNSAIMQGDFATYLTNVMKGKGQKCSHFPGSIHCMHHKSTQLYMSVYCVKGHS